MVARSKVAPVGVRWLSIDGMDVVEGPGSMAVGESTKEKKGFMVVNRQAADG